MLDQRSCGWLACSEVVKQMLQIEGEIASKKVHTLPPRGFDLSHPLVGWSEGVPKPWRLVLIGEQSFRKDPAFAVLVLHTLRSRGHQIGLEHYGIAGNAQESFDATVTRLGLNHWVQLHGWHCDPASELDRSCIHLIAAKSEPFGLIL